MKSNPVAPVSKQSGVQKEPIKEQTKESNPKTQPQQQPQQQIIVSKTAQLSPPKTKAPSNDKDHLQKMMQTMLSQQSKYFETLKNSQDQINQKVSTRAAEKVEDKILNAIRKGLLSIENSKFNYVESHMMDKKVLTVEKEKDNLQSKLHLVDSELQTLKKQKINNPYSAYSQPTMQIYLQEENLNKQQAAQETVQKIQQETKTRREKNKKQREEEEKKMNEYEIIQKQQGEEKANELKKQLKEKILSNIEDLKEKQRTRLEKMDKLEDEYFKSLNDKLDKLAKERSLGGEIRKVKLEPYKSEEQKKIEAIQRKNKKKKPRSASPDKGQNDIQNHPHQTIEIEMPLYMRVMEQYHKKIQKQQDKVNDERKKHMEMNKNYNQEYEEHMKEYLKKLKAKQREYQQKRITFLKKLGIEEGKFSQNVNASFDSKLWVLQESSINDITILPRETMIKQAKEKNEKKKDYDLQVKKTIPIKKDQTKEEQILVSKDKTLHPERYIKMVKKKDKEQEHEKDIEIYYKQTEEEEKKEAEKKQKEKEKFLKVQEKLKEQLKQSIVRSKINEEDPQESDELEYEETLAKQKGKEYLKEFKELHSKALEMEKGERKNKLEEEQKKKKFELPVINQTPKLVKNQTLGTLERHDYLQEVLQQAKREREERKEKDKIEKEEKIKQEERRKEEEKRREEEKNRQEEIVKKDISNHIYSQEVLDFKKHKLIEHNQKVDKIKNKFLNDKTYEPQPQESKLKRKADQVHKLEKQTKSLESLAEAQWTMKPLKAVEKTSEVDALYVKSIEERLKLLK